METSGNFKQIYFSIVFNVKVDSWNVKQFYLTHWSDTLTSGQGGPGSDGNEDVFCIPQSSCITGASLSDCY